MNVKIGEVVAEVKRIYADPVVWVVAVAGYTIAYFIDALLGMITVAGVLSFYIWTTRNERDE